MIGQTTSPYTQQSGWNPFGPGQVGTGQYGQFGAIPAMHGQAPFGQQPGQVDIGTLAGSVVSSVLPHILGGQRGQQLGGHGQFGAIPGLQPQGQFGQGQFGQGQPGQQFDLGSILGPVVASVLGTLQGQPAQAGTWAGRA